MRLVLRLLRAPLILLALVLVCGGGTYLLAPQWLLQASIWRQARAAHLDRHELLVGDTRWSYYAGGDGPTLVLLHGIATDNGLWLPVAQQLGAHFRLVIPDLPGWGKSSRLAGGNYDIDAQAARLQAFLQALGLQHVVLVGQGTGGAIAGVVAAQHPREVAGLVLIDSFGLKSKPTAFDRALQAGNDPYAFDNRKQFHKALATAFAQPPTVPERIADVYIARNKAARAFTKDVLSQLRAPAQTLALQHRLAQLDMPVLAIWGRDDTIVDLSALDALRSGLIHARSISTSVINHCGHLPPLEQPATVAQVITTFLLTSHP